MSAICGLWKIYKCLFIPNCTRKIMWLLINNIYEKIARWLSRRNAPSRACAWFENKRFDWPTVIIYQSLINDQSDWLVCFLFLHWINSFLHCFWKETALLLTNQNGDIFSCILLGPNPTWTHHLLFELASAILMPVSQLWSCDSIELEELFTIKLFVLQ